MANYKRKNVEELQTSTPKQERPKRVPVSGPRDILTVPDMDPNYHYRWVNDVVGRIDKFLRGGWEIVQDVSKVGSPTVDRGSRLGSAQARMVGNNIVAVLMRIPMEYYKEDQLAKQEQIDDLEAAMRPADADYGSLKIGNRSR